MISQILSEIKFRNSWRAKSAILTYLKALNFDFYEFLHFWRLKFTESTKYKAPKIKKWRFSNMYNPWNWFHVKSEWQKNPYIFTHFEALNFDFYEFFHFLKAEIHQIDHFLSPKIAKTSVLEVPKMPFFAISVL